MPCMAYIWRKTSNNRIIMEIQLWYLCHCFVLVSIFIWTVVKFTLPYMMYIIGMKMHGIERIPDWDINSMVSIHIKHHESLRIKIVSVRPIPRQITFYWQCLKCRTFWLQSYFMVCWNGYAFFRIWNLKWEHPENEHAVIESTGNLNSKIC